MRPFLGLVGDCSGAFVGRVHTLPLRCKEGLLEAQERLLMSLLFLLYGRVIDVCVWVWVTLDSENVIITAPLSHCSRHGLNPHQSCNVTET